MWRNFSRPITTRWCLFHTVREYTVRAMAKLRPRRISKLRSSSTKAPTIRRSYKTVRAVDPHHLYLGSWTQPRLHPTDWPIMAANCDVIGLDFYSPTFLDSGVQALIQSTKKPVLVGEYSFPSDYGGMRGFGVAVIKAKSRLQIRSPATSMRNGCRLRPPIPTWWESNGSNTWTSRLPGAATTMASRTSHPAWCSARMPRSEWWTAPPARSTTW